MEVIYLFTSFGNSFQHGVKYKHLTCQCIKKDILLINNEGRYVYIVVPTNYDSDVIFCLYLLSNKAPFSLSRFKVPVHPGLMIRDEP